MNALIGREQFLEWLLNHSLQAGLLVLLVLLTQRVFRRQLTPRWRFVLWWIVLVRLLLPVGPESAVSVFNWFRSPVVLSKSALTSPTRPTPATVNLNHSRLPAGATETGLWITTGETGPADVGEAVPATRGVPLAAPAPEAHPALSLANALALVWLGGVLSLSLCVVVQVVRFQLRLRQATIPVDPSAAALLKACRREFGITRRLELLETNGVTSPALFGLFRLRLLVPRGMMQQFTADELRYIFLHEMAHIKRGDLWINWLVTGLQIVHWFNPLIWFGFARLRSDRELACDELTLLRAGEQVGTAYGETVIKLLEGLSRPAAIPGLVGILEDTQQMRRRIRMIANFRKPGRWSALAALLLAAVAAATLTDGKAPGAANNSAPNNSADTKSSGTNFAATFSPNVSRPVFLSDGNSTVMIDPASQAGLHDWLVDGQNPLPNLTGEVHAKSGSPLAATVFVATAAPKIGTSTFCPSCYADCRKSAKADAQGQFRIKSLDPQLTFKILAVAKGYKPKYVEKVDPAKGPVKIALDPIEASDATPDRSLRGRVVDAKGAPIEGAAVEMEGVWRNEGGGWGAIPGVDPLAVSDERGEFLLTAKEPFNAMDVKVTARTFADRSFTHVTSKEKAPDLVMTEGSTVKGRVLANGKPLKGVKVGVSGVDRSAGNYIGNFEIGTGNDGDFVFMNLPPDADYWIYGIMDTLKPFGAIPIRKLHVPKDGATLDVGDLAITPAYRLAGKVVLADGAAVPPNTRLLVGREEAWDVTQLTLGADGSFDTAGIPAETVSLSARVKGYRWSAQNASFEAMNLRIVGRMDRDITNLVLLLEKGDERRTRPEVVGPESDWPQNRPLHGAEVAPDHSHDWTISGRVLDADTKQPIQNFRVTPGQHDQFDHVVWDEVHGFDGTGGAYTTHLSKRIQQPILLVEADGFLPNALFLAGRDATDADFILKRGSGPQGTVRSPDGQPAAGASVALLNDSYNQTSLQSKGEFMSMRGRRNLSKADAEGRFTFNPEWGSKFVAAASSNGFAAVPVERLATNPVITLEPYGRVTGTLERTSGAGTNEQLLLTFSGSQSFSGINLSHNSTSDSQGRFSFDRVPPGHLRIFSFGPASGSHQHNLMGMDLKEFDLKPGQSLELNVEAGNLAAEQTWSGPPPIKRISGEELKGVVLSPNGKPAADAQVAVGIQNQHLALGRATLESYQLQQEGLLVRTDAEGRFAMPLCEGAKFLVAVNEDGFANISVADFNTSPKIALQKWGRIEGSLRIHGRPATNEWVSVGVKYSAADPEIYYQSKAFEARTDDQGRFAFTLIPPGSHTISRRVALSERSWTSAPLGTVEVKPNETARTNFVPTGFTVTGKMKLPEGDATYDFKHAHGFIRKSLQKILERLSGMKSDDERRDFMESDEYKAAYKDVRWHRLTVAPDGSFSGELVQPGDYEIGLDSNTDILFGSPGPSTVSYFVSQPGILIPEAAGTNEDATLDLGVIELHKFTQAVLPAPRASAK